MVIPRMFYVAFGIFLFSATSSDACDQKITAALTEEHGFGYYIFSGNKYTYFNRIKLLRSPNTPAQVNSVLDWEGMDDDVHVTIDAGYMNPDANNTMIFAGKKVYKVDILKKKVLEKQNVDEFFTKGERKHLVDGIQAAAFYKQDVYYFSGCKLLVKHANGKHRVLTLDAKGLPCDVDSVFNYPKRGSPNLMITKGDQAYGLMMGSGTALAYDLYCINGHLPRIALDLCECT